MRRMRTRRALALLAGALLPLGTHAAASDTPLLDYAAEQHYATMPHEETSRERLARITHEIERHSPPLADCARTLGAARFGQMFDELAAARAALGDHEGAAEAYGRALDCSPRDFYLHAGLASELMHLGRAEQARAVVLQGLAIAPKQPWLTAQLALIEFAGERWRRALELLQQAARTDEDPTRAMYWQCFLWLAQQRAGIERPVLADRDPVEEWPAPLLQALRGELDEAQLLALIEDEPAELRRREMLAEALYYTGQQRLAAGDAATARRYFAATVNLKVLYFTEHHMALAELAKAGEPDPS